MALREKKTIKYHRLKAPLADSNVHKAENEPELNAEELDTDGAELEDEELDANLDWQSDEDDDEEKECDVMSCTI
ncbi:hypothetical protein MMC14_003688 [Varicellaria rhodocarpa]|nr:hypothetical protein [Varicellaria rhodocarpa]